MLISILKKNKFIPVIVLIISLLIAPNAYAELSPYGPGSYRWEIQKDGGRRLQFGDQYIIGWYELGNQIYLFSAEGYLLTGWQFTDGLWHYFSEIDTEKYPMGALYRNCTTPDGRVVDESGVLHGTDIPVHGNPYGYTCVDVNVTTQTVNVYIGNALYLTSPCVTGTANSKRSTSIGKFAIYMKETNRYLQGLNADGTKYKSWVNYWMPFNGGEGLHDASWRGSFGGNIYKYNGSHGCVNLPVNVAPLLYEVAYIGMPVIVHE